MVYPVDSSLRLTTHQLDMVSDGSARLPGADMKRSPYRPTPPVPALLVWPRVALAAYALGRALRRHGPSRRARAIFGAGLLMGAVVGALAARPVRRCHLERVGSGVALVADALPWPDREIAYLPRVDEAFELARRVGCEVRP